MWLLSGRCRCKNRMDGNTVVITGANCGIGKATAIGLVQKGARVILACRDLKKAQEAVDDIRNSLKDEEGVGEMIIVKLDLSSLESVRQCAQHLLRTEPKIHILINNAGVCFVPKGKTSDGFDMHMGVNHLGHFLFTCLLLPRIIHSAPARIVVVSSCGAKIIRSFDTSDLNWEKRSYNNITSYVESKLANLLFSVELAGRLQGKGVTTYTVHPGLVVTDSARYVNLVLRWCWEKLMVLVCKTPEQGAQTSIHCAVSEQLADQTGQYYSDCKLTARHFLADDEKLRGELWDKSCKLVGLGDWDPFTARDTGELPQQ